MSDAEIDTVLGRIKDALRSLSRERSGFVVLLGSLANQRKDYVVFMETPDGKLKFTSEAQSKHIEPREN
jgi:hypothetical protein